MNVRNNIEAIQNQLLGKNCRLIAVSKTHTVERVQEAYDAGQRIFGENKVQELIAKQAVLPKDIEWHMIGHLQTNKAKQLVPVVSLIHAVDSFKLLDEINKQAKKIGRMMPCLLQVHIASEETKFGFDLVELMELINSEKIASLDSIKIKGLMGMATFTENQGQVRNEFRNLKKLFDQI